jgi:predicted DNA-binding transcriptional regulator AlpA
MVDVLVRARDIFAGQAGRPPLIAIGRTKFFNLIKSGEFPPADARIGGAVLWRLSTVQDWIESTCSAGQGGGR